MPSRPSPSAAPRLENDEPKRIAVSDARALGKNHDLDRIVILWQRGDDVGYASYGRDREMCHSTRRLADVLYAEMFDWTLAERAAREDA